jgi:hypothetical protein
MAQSAKVLSIQALKDFRIALVNFTDEARNALSGVDMELKRMRDWLERDQLSYWQMQVKRRHEAMMMARTELFRRRVSQQGSDAISDTEQKEALQEAQRRLRIAEEKVEAVKKLIPIFHHALAEYVSRATPLADHLSGGIDRSLGSLTKMIESLESYLALSAPTAPPVESMGGSGPGMTSARVGGSAAGVDARDLAEAGADQDQGNDDAPAQAIDAIPNSSPVPVSSTAPKSNQEHDS